MRDAMKRLSRRRFVTTMGAALGLPYAVGQRVLGAAGRRAPSDRLVFGHIGVGGMGGAHLNDILGRVNRGETSVAAVCDIDEKRLEGAWQRTGRNAR